MFTLLCLTVRTAVACLLCILTSRRFAIAPLLAEVIAALGVNISLLYTLLFVFGACLAGLAGVMAAPFIAVEAGMGESVLILTFVVIVIGGIGSIKGAVAGALLIGIADTLGRVYIPELMRLWLPPAAADGAGASLASMAIYILMAAVLILRPAGLFGARA